MGIELGKTTGKINLTNVSGNIELNNNNGNVDLTNEKENIELNGVSGDIELVIKGGGSSVEIDDTLSIAGAAADAAATGEAIEKVAYKLDSLPTGYDEGAMVSATNLTPDKRINLKVRNKNVFDVSGVSIGYTCETFSIGSTAWLTTRANTKHCAAHGNVPVKPDTHYVFSLDNTDYWMPRLIEVDENNICVRHHAYYATKQDNAVKAFITKETTVKLYIAFEKRDGTPATMEEIVALNFQLEVGDTPTPFTPYVDVANREVVITGKNIFKPTDGISASDFENKEIGDKMPTEFIEGIYQIHPYTPLKPNTYYTYSTQATRGQGWQGYMAKEIYEADENDIIVAKYSFTPEQPYTKFTFKTTPTTKYMLVNIGGIAFTTGTTLDEKSLKVRDFQFEEGNDESGSDFYYEEIYTTDKNGCVNGIAFPRDKAHAHIKDKGLVIELEVEEIEAEIDTTLSKPGIAADAAATGYSLGELKDRIDNHDEGAVVSATNLTPETKVNLKVKSKNEFDISGIALGKKLYGGSVGTPIQRLDNRLDYATHSYVPVKPSTHYVFSLDNTNYCLSRICEMDENDLTIRNHGYHSTTGSDFSVKSFITKETTKYLYIEFKNKNDEEATLEGLEATHFQLEIGDTPTPFTPYTSGINREIKVIGKNIFNGDNGIGASDFENKEIGAKMPTKFIAGKNQIHPYIPVKPDTYYTFSFQAARGLGWQSYMVKEIFEADENDVIVARYLFDESHNKYTFKTTPTTKYILVSIAFINGNSVSNAGYQLRVRDFQLEEGKDESATDFYYEETYTTDENGLIEGITFPRTELNAYPIDKGLIIELEVEEEKSEVEQIEVDATLSQPGAAADAAATGYMFKNYNAFAETTTKEFLLDTNSNGYAVHEGKLGLVIGETYTIERYIDGECVDSFEGLAEEDWYGKGCASLYATTLGDVENEIYVDYQLTDGIAYNPSESVEMYGDYYSIENWNQDDSVEEFTVYITGKFLSKIPLESMYLANNVMDGIPFPVSSDAVSKEIAALDKKVAYVVQNIGGKNGINEILFPETKNYNRAEVRLGMFVNGKQDIYYNPDKNHLAGNGDYGFISEEGFSTFGICLTPEELRGTEGNYYVVIDIQLLTMTSTSGAVHCKIDSTFYKYGDGITSVKTQRNVEDLKPYKKSIDTMYFYYGRSSMSSIDRGFIHIDDGANTVFNGTSGKITYYQK